MGEDVEKQDGPLDETFTWAAGYNEGETPHNMPEFGNDIPVPQSPVRKDRHVSEVPSNGSLPEDEDERHWKVQLEDHQASPDPYPEHPSSYPNHHDELL
jgi:hypothetical protein